MYRNLFFAAAANVTRYRARSLVVLICLVAICGPYLTGVAISEGIRADAMLAVREGADLYLTFDCFGRNGPVPLKYLPAFRKSPYITAVIPRIVGRASVVAGLSDSEQSDPELVVILGLEPGQMRLAPYAAGAVLARKVQSGEVIVGAALAGRWGLHTGQRITLKVADVTMPFRIAAVLPTDATIWSTNSSACPWTTPETSLRSPGFASDFGISCRPGPGNVQAVRQIAFEILGDIPYRLQTKNAEVAAYVDKGFRQQQGVFTVFYLVAFAVGIPALLAASGVGLSERNREIAIRKAVGWRTSEVLTMVVFEQVLLSVIAACLSVLLCFLWVRIFNGVIVAQFFIAELGSVAPFRLPALFSPAPPALALLLCLSITLAGSLLTTWHLATRPPAESLR